MLVTMNELSQGPDVLFREEFQGIEAQIAEYHKQIEQLEADKQELAAKAAVGREALLKLENALNVLGDNETFRSAVASLVSNVSVETEPRDGETPTQFSQPEESPQNNKKHSLTESTVSEEKRETKLQAKPETKETKVKQKEKPEVKLSPELPLVPEPGESHTLQFAVSRHNSTTKFLVVAKAGEKYECLNSQGRRIFFPKDALNFLASTKTEIPADFTKFNQPLPQELLSDAVWGRMQLLAVTDKEEFEEAKSRLKVHQEGLLGSLWKYWLTDEDKQKIEEAAQKESEKIA